MNTSSTTTTAIAVPETDDAISTTTPSSRKQDEPQQIDSIINASGSTCKYSSKPCALPRALKKTGDLHSFCEFHRDMANRNQRRCELKRRTQRQAEKATRKRILQPQQLHVLLGMPAFHPSKVVSNFKRRRVILGTSPTSVEAATVVQMPSINLYNHNHSNSILSASSGVARDQPLNLPAFLDFASQSLEPYAHPVPLHGEDLDFLLTTIADSTFAFTV